MAKNSAALKAELPDNDPNSGLGTLTHVRLGALRYGHDPDAGEQINARVTNREEGLESLKALVQAYGIVVPLIVVNRGRTATEEKLFVLNGNRRVKVMRDLLKLPADTMVPVRAVDAPDGKALEISLVTAISELKLHPVDEFEGFSKVLDNLMGKEHGLDYNAAVARVAHDFGREKLEVEKALALGRLSQTIRDAWRSNHIATDTAEAFTLGYDFAAGDIEAGHKVQDALFKKLDKAGRLYGHIVRTEFRKESTDQRLASYVNFVGVDEFQKAGGKMTRDLFHNDHVIHTPNIAKDLAEKKLVIIANDLVANKGWSWAKPDFQMPKGSEVWSTLDVDEKPTPAEKKRRNEIDDILSGEVEIDVTDEQEAALEAERNKIDEEIEDRAYTDAVRKKSGVVVLITNKGELRLRRGVVEPRAATAPASKGAGGTGGGLGLGGGSTAAAPTKKQAVSGALSIRLRIMRDKATRKALVADVKAPRLPALLASLVASLITIEPGFNSTPHEVDKKLDTIRDMVTPKIMNDALRAEFDAEDYFANVSSDHRIKQLVDMGLKPDKKAKKSELIKLAVKEATAHKWLPKELRTSHYDGPGSKGAKKKR